jgi:uncharacterized protein (DUF1778 family)
VPKLSDDKAECLTRVCAEATPGKVRVRAMAAAAVRPAAATVGTLRRAGLNTAAWRRVLAALLSFPWRAIVKRLP